MSCFVATTRTTTTSKGRREGLFRAPKLTKSNRGFGLEAHVLECRVHDLRISVEDAFSKGERVHARPEGGCMRCVVRQSFLVGLRPREGKFCKHTRAQTLERGEKTTATPYLYLTKRRKSTIRAATMSRSSESRFFLAKILSTTDPKISSSSSGVFSLSPSPSSLLLVCVKTQTQRVSLALPPSCHGAKLRRTRN